MTSKVRPRFFIVSSPMMQRLLHSSGSRSPTAGNQGQPGPDGKPRIAGEIILGERLKEVAFLAYCGFKNREIAERVGVKTRTVKGYFTELYLRLNVSGRYEMFRSAIELGVIQPAGEDRKDLRWQISEEEGL